MTAASDGPALLIVTDDGAFAEELESRGAAEGLSPHTVAPDRLDSEGDYAVAIIDLSGQELEDFEDKLAPIRRIPSVVLLDRLKMEDRLAVIRAGGRIALSRNSDPAAITHTAAALLYPRPTEDSTVLLVDDDEAILLMARAYLERIGVTVETLMDPADFLSTLERVEPDVLILDVHMPGVNGVELCRIVRSDPTRAGLPILFLTGSVDPRVISKVFRAGADDFIRKPFIGPEFIARIRNRLERVRLSERLAELDP